MEAKMEVEAGTLGSHLHHMPEQDAGHAFASLTAGQLVGAARGPKLRFTTSLQEAAAALAESGRSAAVVLDETGKMVGLFTENDVLRSFFEELDPDTPLAHWLAGSMARAPAKAFDRLVVAADAKLSAVAERMVQNALAGDCSCHHVLVAEGASGSPTGFCTVLSTLDIVQALWRPGIWSWLTSRGPLVPTAVGDVMKPREGVFTCLPSDPMKEVLRLLLMTQQNGIMVVDDEGAWGMITPRDVVQAFADGVGIGVQISVWLCSLNRTAAPRVIESTATLEDAAAMMVPGRLHHLIVVRPGTQEAVGVLSSTDMALFSCQRAAPATWQVPLQQGSGPTVREIVAEQWHLHALCDGGATLAEAARFLSGSGRTSAAVSLSENSSPLGLLTDVDLMRAYVSGWASDCSVDRWLLVQESNRPAIIPPLLVPLGAHLSEAAALMVRAGSGGREPCEHLVAKGSGFGWEGIFSALDVARALCNLGSQLEVAKLGVDQMKVSAVMKHVEKVPMCKDTISLKDAFQLLIGSFQHGMLVFAEDGTFKGLLTTRCALTALAENAPSDGSVASWLERHPAVVGRGREIDAEAPIVEAAAQMTKACLHHLVVKAHGRPIPVGVISAMDVVRGVASARNAAPLNSMSWLWSCRGPASAELKGC